MRRSVVLLAALAAACSGDDPPDPPPDTPGIALSELCAEVARVDCERAAECGLLSGPVDQDTCEARQTALLCAAFANAIGDAVEADTLSYFELAARDCRSAVGERSCDFGFDYDLYSLPACATMLEAGGAEGSDCHLAAACPDGFYCDVQAECPGTCRAYKQNNEACGFTDRCADGLFCGVTTRRCLAQVEINSACEPPLSGNSCRPGGFCDQTQPAMPTCSPVRGQGGGCQNPNECLVGARCIRNRCSLGEDGDACDQPEHCNAGLVCSGGSCAAPVAAGADCMPGGVPCRTGYLCTGDMGMTTCMPQATAGGACLGDGDCFLGRCENDMCVASLEDGATCTGARECLPGRTCDSVCIAPVRNCAR